MADLYEPDVGAAYYRTRDPLKNLKIKVKLNRITSVSIVPQAQIEEQQGDNVELRNIQNAMHEQNFGGQKDGEEYTFKWQEKVFCQREMEAYSKLESCSNVLERKYHEETTLIAETGRPTKRLFSYVDHDGFMNQEEQNRLFTTSPNETPTYVAEKMSHVRFRRNAAHKYKNENLVVPKTNVIDYEPSEDKKKQNHYISSAVKTMYIMADLTPAGRPPGPDDEAVLCTIKIDLNGVLSVKPDFNNGSKAYRVDLGGTKGREMFEYTLEHASTQLSWKEQEKESKMFRELYGRHQEFLAACVGHDFEMPPQDCLRLLVYGEIESAQEFEYDDLYIQYLVDVPDGWFPNGSQHLLGVTQTSRTKTVDRDQVAYFSYPFNFELVYRKDPVQKDNEALLPKWPQIFLEIASLDSWQRHRVEGYGHLSLPAKHGQSQHTVRCWRPAGRSVASELRRFFIGGSAELEDLTFMANPSTFDGTHLSKFGFRTVSTGSVSIRINTILQSNAFLQSAVSKKKVGSVLDRIGFSAAQANIMNVLDAFQRAKNRMIAARENLKRDYIETVKAQEPDTDDE